MKRPLLILLCLLLMGAYTGDVKVIRFQHAAVSAPDLPVVELTARWQALTSAGHPFLIRLDRGAALPARRQPIVNGLRWLAPVPPRAWIVQAVDRAAPILPSIRWCGPLPPDAKLGPGMNKHRTYHALRVRQTAQPTAIMQLNRQVTLNSLLQNPRVWMIDVSRPSFRPANDIARALAGADLLQDSPWNLNGRNVTIAIWDEGKVSHPDFDERLTNVRAVAVSEHSTHVAGTMAGDGKQSNFRIYRGIAPAATIFAWDFEDPLADLPAALNRDVIWGNNSWTYWIENSLDNCELLNAYDDYTASYDEHLALDEPPVIGMSFGAGNMADMNDCGISLRDGYMSLPPPGTAKNVITVGSTDDGRSLSYFSSMGPTSDGRIKPDVVALGCESDWDGYVTSTLPGGIYGAPGWCGTSMATPQVTGAIALLWQQAKKLKFNPTNSLVKALIIAGARNIGRAGPSFSHGWGHLDIATSVAMLKNEAYDAGSLTAEEDALEWEIEIPADWPQIEITLVWDDPPASPTAEQTLVNDLDLRLVGPKGVAHPPWTLDPVDYDLPAARNEDHLNNVEQVRVKNPAAGTWIIRVSATVLQSEQHFSLAGWMLGGLTCDRDGDRAPGAQCDGDDCNDNDPLVHRGAVEICGDDIDQDCDGNIDEGCGGDIPDDDDDDGSEIIPDEDEDKEEDRDDDDNGGCGC